MKLRLPLAVTAVAALAAVAATSALGHARILPATAFNQTQLYTLAVPNEKEDATVTKVVLTVPDGFGIRMFDPTEGWERQVETTGTGEDERISRVTWTASGDGNADGGLFLFTAGADAAGSYTFEVEQSYSDGSVVDWSGPEDADEPAPVVEVVDSLGSDDGGDSSSTLALVALIVGAAGLVVGGIALARSSGRKLA